LGHKFEADRRIRSFDNFKVDMRKRFRESRGLGKMVACQSRQAEVAKLEAKQIQATNKVAAEAKPEGADFAKLVAWLSNGALQPGAADFDNLWLFFRTLLPQVGGLVLMLARR
jgi:hypothetical protein